MHKLVLILTLLPLTTFARTGSEGGGGGNKLIAEFVAAANSLIARQGFAPEHATLLKGALERSRIVTTKQLLDPATNRPFPNQEKLIAWGSPGLVQLKEKGVLFEDSFEDALATSRPIAHIVVHELFRASGATGPDGKSIDENFQISIGQYHLEQDATGSAIRLERGGQFLYAECKVVRCERTGSWWDNREDLTCNPSEEARKHGIFGYLNATISIYKYAGTNKSSKKDGMYGIRDAGPQVENRLGNEHFESVKILDGETEMQLVSDSEGWAYRDFRIEYSTRRKPVTSGHLEIQYSDTKTPSWVVMDLGNCQTRIN